MGCEQTWCECMELAALALLVRFLSDISFPGCVVSKCPHVLPHRNTDWCSMLFSGSDPTPTVFNWLLIFKVG